MKQFPARTQSEDALTEQLAKLGLKDGRVQAPAAPEDSTDSTEPSPDDGTDTDGEPDTDTGGTNG